MTLDEGTEKGRNANTDDHELDGARLDILRMARL